MSGKVLDDVNMLRDSMKGLGTDEEKVIQVLGSCDVKHRGAIEKLYKSVTGEDLKKRLKSELSGHFERAVLLSFDDQAHVKARALYHAISGAGTTEHVLVQTICTCNNDDIEALKWAYKDILEEKKQNTQNRDLEKDVANDTSGDFKRVLVALLQGLRGHNKAEENLQADVEALHKAADGKLGTDEAVLTEIFVNRSYETIRNINREYVKTKDMSLEELLKKEVSGAYGDALKTIFKTAMNKAQCIGDMLEASMAGAGTKDDDLIRLILTYAEDNMDEIKKQYEQYHGKSLADRIASDTSGDYKKFLLAVIRA